jgi:hypothetical protein
MSPSSLELASLPFVTMSTAFAAAPQGRFWLIDLFVAPFRDVDDRPAREAAKRKEEKEGRAAATTGAAMRHRR